MSETTEPVVTYAPNGEDIVLWRALGHLSPGYFVDVGAYDPVITSITKLFSLRGWRGINIEPLPHMIELLELDRPDDINLRTALSDSEGEMTLYVVVDDIQRTTLSESLAELYRNEGYQIEEQPTPVQTLNTILGAHPLPRIDFLKIDAEGMEDAIVRGLDLTKHQPLVIVAEEGSHQHYEFPSMLLDAGYRELLWDGLNRFFASPAADDELCQRLSCPAGLHEGYIRRDLRDALDEARRAHERSAELDEHVDAIHRSSTWRVGAAVHAPIRLARRWTGR